jgi:uncharacterized protein (TIGR02996 family)
MGRLLTFLRRSLGRLTGQADRPPPRDGLPHDPPGEAAPFVRALGRAVRGEAAVAEPLGRAFLRDIAEHLGDDAPRLVYADWLEEHGRPERAELIRLQCALPALAWDDPRRGGLTARQEELLAAHGETWREPAGVGSDAPFERGFQEVALVWRMCVREVATPDDLREATRTERGVLFLGVSWSVQSYRSRAVVAEMVRAWLRGGPAAPVAFYRVDLSDQECAVWDGVAKWLAPPRVPAELWGGGGALVWVRRGTVCDHLVSAAGHGVEALVERTRRAFAA